MRVVVFGAALLACTVPAFGQAVTTHQPLPPSIPGSCEAALFSPGVPSGVVVVTVPTPALPAGEVLGAGHPVGTRSTLVPPRPGIFIAPSPSAGVAPGVGIVSGAGGITTSGVGSIGTSGVGSIATSGVGSMATSGVGSIGMGGVGSIGASGLGVLPGPSAVTGPFAPPKTPSPMAGSYSPGANVITPPLPVAPQRFAFICP